MILLLLLAGVAASGCVARYGAPPPTGDAVTIFIPGYKGSFLVTDDARHERAWITPGEALSSGDRTLAVPFPGQRLLKMFGPLVPDGPVTGFSIFPFVSRDYYLSWLQFGARELPGFIPFAYDWRQDIRASARELGTLIDQLASARNGVLRVNLIGHSMGGLVALYYLRYGGDPVLEEIPWTGAAHVRKVVFLGVPFGGSPGIFGDLLQGTPTWRNHALLSRDALFTFASVFQLLPPGDDFFYDESGLPVRRVVCLAATWEQEGWGVFEDPRLRDEPAYRRQIARMLAARRDFAHAMRAVDGPPPQQVKALVVVGHGHLTTDGVRVTGDRFDLEHPVPAEGDDTVTGARAVPPAPLSFARIDTGADHLGLVNDAVVRKEIADFLRY